MSDLPYIPFNIADFLADDKVSLMSTEEVGAYILLLCRAWQQERPGSLPNNDEYLATWTRLAPLRWNQIKDKVMMPFWFNESYPGGEWVQDRMARDHANVSETLAQRSEAGKRGAEARWKKGSVRTQCDRSAKSKKKKDKTNEVKFDWTEDGFIGLTDERKASWADAYPYVDIGSELLVIHQWLLANPKKRKKQYMRFVNSWFARANDKSKGTSNGNNYATEHAETGLGKVVDINGA